MDLPSGGIQNDRCISDGENCCECLQLIEGAGFGSNISQFANPPRESGTFHLDNGYAHIFITAGENYRQLP